MFEIKLKLEVLVSVLSDLITKEISYPISLILMCGFVPISSRLNSMMGVASKTFESEFSAGSVLLTEKVGTSVSTELSLMAELLFMRKNSADACMGNM